MSSKILNQSKEWNKVSVFDGNCMHGNVKKVTILKCKTKMNKT